MARLLTRRRFLIGAAGTGIGAVAGASALAWLTRDYHPAMLFEKMRMKVNARRYPRASLAGAIQDHFNYLAIDPEALDRFAKAYEGEYGAKSWSTSLEDAYERFLLSTDFFQNGADESKPVRYLMLYHPHKSVCYNPLAVLD